MLPQKEFLVGLGRNIHHQLFAIKVKAHSWIQTQESPKIICKRNQRARKIKSLELSFGMYRHPKVSLVLSRRCISLHIDAVYGCHIICPQLHTWPPCVEETCRIDQWSTQVQKFHFEGFASLPIADPEQVEFEWTFLFLLPEKHLSWGPSLARRDEEAYLRQLENNLLLAICSQLQ